MSNPAFQFYPADHLADANVQMMTLEEEGAYIRLLSYCWREGTIPADNASLSRLCKGASDEVINSVKRMFVLDRTDVQTEVQRLRHPRLDEEREKQRLFIKKQSAAGVASGKSRRKKKLLAEPAFDLVRTKPEPKRTLHLLSSDINTPPTPSSEGELVSSEPNKSNPKVVTLVTQEQQTWFEEFWREYWRPVAKKPAQAAYTKHVTTAEQFAAVMAGVRAQKPEMLRREISKRPHAMTWLNQERWLDEVGPSEHCAIEQGLRDEEIV
jgi:uncharacterized protein YdaU (DUF1376 family)